MPDETVGPRHELLDRGELGGIEGDVEYAVAPGIVAASGTEPTRQGLQNHGEAVAFVAAEGEQGTSAEEVDRLRGWFAVLVQNPALGNGLSPQLLDA